MKPPLSDAFLEILASTYGSATNGPGLYAPGTCSPGPYATGSCPLYFKYGSGAYLT